MADCMAEERRQHLVAEVESSEYATTLFQDSTSQSAAHMLAERMVAVFKTFPGEHGRRNGRGTTARAVQLEYLLSGPRGLATASDGAGLLYGTTAAEAFANSLKALFRNVRHILLRTAHARTQAYELSWVLSTHMNATLPASVLAGLSPATRTRMLAQDLRHLGELSPVIDVAVRQNQPKADGLPRAARELKRKPASSAAPKMQRTHAGANESPS